MQKEVTHYVESGEIVSIVLEWYGNYPTDKDLEMFKSQWEFITGYKFSDITVEEIDEESYAITFLKEKK